MKQFDYENSSILKEINKLPLEEKRKWNKFIIKKNLETKGKYFTDKLKRLKPSAGFKKNHNPEYSVEFIADKFFYHAESTEDYVREYELKWLYPYRIGNFRYYKEAQHSRDGIKINLDTKIVAGISITHHEPIIGNVGLFNLKKIIIGYEYTSWSISLLNIKSEYMGVKDTLSFLNKALDASKYDFVIKFIEKYFSFLEGSLTDYREFIEREQELLKIKNEKLKKKKEKIELDKQKTSEKKNVLIKELDKDLDGTLDVVQTDDFHELLKKHEKSIIEIDRDYIKNFVKLSNYLKTIRNNLQNTFEILSKVEFSKDLESLKKILKNKIHAYNSLLFHSLSMIVSLTKDEMITFYEIYEMFDELNVYDSKFEKDMLSGIKSVKSELEEVNKNLKEVGGKLGHISGQFYDLMNQMKESDERIINSIDNLTYTTSSSIESLSNTVQGELNSINSSIKFNNLLTGIQTYQMYKVNLNTKSLKG